MLIGFLLKTTVMSTKILGHTVFSFFKLLLIFFYSGAVYATGIGPPDGLDGIGVLILLIQYLVLPIIALFYLAKYLIPEFSKPKDGTELETNTVKRRAVLSWLLPLCALTINMVSELVFYGAPLFSLSFFFSIIVHAVGVFYFVRTAIYFFSEEKKGLYSHFGGALVLHCYLFLSYLSLLLVVTKTF